MAPIPPNVALQLASSNEAALQLNTLLAFGAILFAAMQGVLCKESADPCRISHEKLLYLVGLEALEVIVVIVSEVLSFVDLRGPLRARLTWLQWLPPCLLVLGLLELIVDVYFTLICTADSRVFWVPFSYVRKRKKSGGFNFRIIIELVPLFLTGISSLMLVGWRQKWWMVAGTVSSIEAEMAAKRSGALSVGALGFCIGWGFLLTIVLLCTVIYVVFESKQYEEWPYLFNPNEYWRRFSERDINCYVDSDNSTGGDTEMQRAELNNALYKALYESSELKKLTSQGKQENVRTAPVCVGNAIVDRNDISRAYKADHRELHMIVLFVENFTILPLQICVVIGLWQVHKSLDAETLIAVKELVDAVIVVAFVEIAVGIKTFLWGAAGAGELHKYDKRIGDP